MTTVKKIPFYDLREEAHSERIPALLGRDSDIERLDRLIGRRTNNNVIIVGESGMGKTSLAHGWARHLSTQQCYDNYVLVQFDSEHLYELDNEAEVEAHYAVSLAHMPSAILLIDDFGREIYKNVLLLRRVHQLYKKLIARHDVHIILTMQQHEYAWLKKEYPMFLQAFEILELKQQTLSEYTRILFKKIPMLNGDRHIIVPDEALKEIVTIAKRYPALGQLPRCGVHILDEALSLSVSKGEKVLTNSTIAHIVESKTGIPDTNITQNSLTYVRHLHRKLAERIIGQKPAVARISSVLQRAKLGLRSKGRPLGSFLMLGPSGVGKTETAKSVADIMFGRTESFTRIDMSEFQQEHMVQRLIGSPPGYVGYEEGGTLTNALKSEPHSLILLDEIEKAHPKVFDIFLQVLDDGRLTSGQGETLDAQETIIMATSNVAVDEIMNAYTQGRSFNDESFMSDIVLPALSQTFRLEFINRFDAIVLFAPLTEESLLDIAYMEIKKAEKRFTTHNVQFSIERDTLRKHIQSKADPRFGARPIKRFIEETCESMVAESLLSQNT